MIASARYVCATVFALILTACGGGGGGGGSFPVAATATSAAGQPAATTTSTSSTATTGPTTPTDTGTTTTPPDTGATDPGPAITAKRGTLALSADSSGAYSVKPGPISINSSLPITGWSFSNAGSHVTVTRDPPPYTSYNWSGKLGNSDAAQALTLTVSYLEGTETRTRDIVINLGAADARNGAFTMYATSGRQYELDLDFDYGTYSVSNIGGLSFQGSGTLQEDASEPGTFMMKGPASASLAFNPFRLRMSEGVIVGASALPSGFASTGGNLYVTPFVAAKTTAATPAAVDGVYTFMRLLSSDSGSSSLPPSHILSVGQVQVSGGGSTYTVCQEVTTISQFTSCAGTLVTYTGTPDGGYQSVGGDQLNIRFVSFGGETIMLSSGPEGPLPSDPVFRIAVPDNSGDWTQAVARGGDLVGAWTTYTVGPTSISMAGTWLTGGAASATDLLWSQPYPSLPQNLRLVGSGPSFDFAMQSSKLLIAIGIGYGAGLQLALKD